MTSMIMYKDPMLMFKKIALDNIVAGRVTCPMAKSGVVFEDGPSPAPNLLCDAGNPADSGCAAFIRCDDEWGVCGMIPGALELALKHAPRMK
jgi:hypothetical protein